MSDEREKNSLEWLHPASQLMLMAVAVAIGEITWFGLRHFPWFADFEDRHNFWATFLCYWAIYPAMYLFRRKRRFADQRQFRADFQAGRLRRPSLALRCTVMLLALGLVVAAPLVENAWPLLIIGVPVLLVFAAEEVNIILRPGEMVRTDPHDELLAFFRQRTLQVGYSVAIASIAALFVVSQFASQYLRELLPVALVVSLLVPAFYYTRLDRQAAADE